MTVDIPRPGDMSKKEPMDQSITKDEIPKGSELEEEGIDEVGREAEEESIEEDGSEIEEATDNEHLPIVTGDQSHGSRSRLCAHCKTYSILGFKTV